MVVSNGNLKMLIKISQVRAALFGLLVVVSANLAAQDSEPLSTSRETFPETGAWWAVDGSKTGFFLEIQDGVLAGAYLGFDGAGNDAWVIFSGQLSSASVSSEVTSILEADLRRTSGGGCIVDCGQNPSAIDPETEVAGTIRIEFIERSLARFSVNGGEMQRIVPMTFGSGGFVEFPEVSDLKLPVLTGKWAGDLLTATVPEPTSVLFDIGPREVTGSGAEKQVVYPVAITAGGVMDLNSITAEASIVCEVTSVFGGGEEPRCQMALPPEVFNTVAIGAQENVFFGLESISDARITFTVDLGTDPPLPGRVNLHRLRYD